MAPIRNIAGAHDRLLTSSFTGDNGTQYAPGRNQPGKCTRWIYLALGATPNVTPLPSAIGAWNALPDANRIGIGPNTYIPKDYPIFLGAASGPRWAGDQNWMYGDVVLSGGGYGLGCPVAGTDSLSGLGVVGTMTLIRRVQQTGRGVLGFSNMYGGWALVTADIPTPEPTPAPDPEPAAEDEDMRILIAQTQYSKDPKVLDTWAFNYTNNTYTHVQSDRYVIGAQAAGAVVLSGPQPPSMFAGFKCADTSGGIR